MIKIEKTNTNQYQVTVSKQTETTHNVTLDDEYYQKLTSGSVDPEVLIKASFEFLLQREDNSSILRTFDLPVIQSYFADYEEIMKKKFS